MRYPASEKLEIIRIVEKSHLPVRRTLEKLASYRKAAGIFLSAMDSGPVRCLSFYLVELA